MQCLRVAAHLGQPGQVRKLMNTVRDRFGRLDILVNNAASGVNRPGLELEEKHWDWALDINMKGPWLCIKEAAHLMPRGGARGEHQQPRLRARPCPTTSPWASPRPAWRP